MLPLRTRAPPRPRGLDAARPPRGDRRKVIDDESDPGVRLDVAELLALREAVTTDVDRVLVGVVPKADGHRVRLAGWADGGDAPEPLASQICDLRRSEDAHPPDAASARGE